MGQTLQTKFTASEWWIGEVESITVLLIVMYPPGVSITCFICSWRFKIIVVNFMSQYLKEIDDSCLLFPIWFSMHLFLVCFTVFICYFFATITTNMIGSLCSVNFNHFSVELSCVTEFLWTQWAHFYLCLYISDMVICFYLNFPPHSAHSYPGKHWSPEWKE